MTQIQNINAFFVALLPVLAVYKIGSSIPLTFVLILLLVVLNFVTGNIKFAFEQKFNEIQWCMSIYIIGLLGFIFNMNADFFDTSLFINNLIALTLFFLALITLTSNFNINVLKKTLLVVGVVAAAICIVQRIQLITTGSFYKDFFLPGLEVNRDLETFSINRVSAFFTEPAHLSIYLIPIYYIALSDKKFLFAILLCLGVMFSGSTTGFLLVLALTSIYMTKNTNKKIYVFYTVVGFVGLYLGIMYLFPDVMIDTLAKLDSTESNSVRLFGTLQYFSLFDGCQWCFGIGLNQLSEFLHSHGIRLITEWGVEKNANYASAVIFMTISYGIFGLTFFIRYIVQTIAKYKSDLGLVVYVLGVLFSDQVLFNMNLLYILAFLTASRMLSNDAK